MAITSYLAEITTIFDADEEIRRLESQLYPLRIHRNSLLPVNQLPCEVLVQIMDNVQEDAIARGDMRYKWISTTQVCKYWRAAAMDDSALWGRILIRLEPSFSKMRWMKELFKRSRSAPISLIKISYDMDKFNDWEGPDSKYLKFWRVLRGHLHQIKAIEYRGGRDDSLRRFPRFNSAASSLESLVIRHAPRYHKFPRCISAPSLRRLHLEECEVIWDTTFLPPTLQTLIIRCASPPIEDHRLASLLTSLPHLRNLELERALMEVGGVNWNRITHGRDRNQLPSLQSLSIKLNTAYRIAPFLCSVDCPNLIRMQLIFDKYEPRSVDERYFHKFLGNVISPILTSKLESSFKESGFKLSIVKPEDRRISVSYIFSTACSQQFWFEFGFLNQLWQWYQIDSFHSIVENIPMIDIKEFTIGDSSWRGDQLTLFDNLSSGPKLEAIVFEGFDYGSGALVLAKYLEKNIPRCDDHQQTVTGHSVRRAANTGDDYDTSLTSNDHLDDSGEDDQDREDDESDEDGSTEEDENVHSGGGSSDEDDENDRNEGEEEVEGCHSCTPCGACTQRGKSFFPALRRLVIRDARLKRWLSINRYEEQEVHPSMGFIVRRIRCGVGIEEVIFETRRERWLKLEEVIRLQFKRFCGDFSPSVRVRFVK